MPVTSGGRWRTIATALACALALAGCDGGIFGTGDGSDVTVPVDSGPPGGDAVTESGDADGFAPGGDTGSDTGSDTGGDTGGVVDGDDTGRDDTGGTDGAATGEGTSIDAVGDVPGPVPPDAPSGTFENTLVGGAESVPRVRLVNADDAPAMLVDEAGEPLLPESVAPGEAGAYVDVPLETGALTVLGAGEDGVGEEVEAYRLEPLRLGASSVTTLVVRDETSGADTPGIGVVALRTLTSPDDPAQTRVRVVLAARLADPDDAAAAETFALVPGGASPGGVEVTFEPLSFDTAPASGYRAVPAGDYVLESSNGGVGSLPVSLAAGTVYTFVVVGPERVLSVVDGAPGAR